MRAIVTPKLEVQVWVINDYSNQQGLKTYYLNKIELHCQRLKIKLSRILNLNTFNFQSLF